MSFGEWSRRNFGWWPTVRFGEFGRWLSLAGTLARVSVLGVLMVMMLIVARARWRASDAPRCRRAG